MAQSNLEVANMALLKLGEDTIAALGGTGKSAQTANYMIEPAKRAVLRMHPWNFAIKRYLHDLDDVAGTANNGGLIRITTTSNHGLSTGDKVTIVDVGGTTEANGTWTITNDGAKLFTLQSSTYSNAWTSGGEWGPAPQFKYTWAHTLPSDCLRVLDVNPDDVNPEWRIENGKILTDIQEPELVYIYDVTSYTLMDTVFYEALSTYLAWIMCPRLTEDLKRKEQLWEDFKLILSKARFVDGTEDSTRTLEASDWIISRLS